MDDVRAWMFAQPVRAPFWGRGGEAVNYGRHGRQATKEMWQRVSLSTDLDCSKWRSCGRRRPSSHHYARIRIIRTHQGPAQRARRILRARPNSDDDANVRCCDSVTTSRARDGSRGYPAGLRHVTFRTREKKNKYRREIEFSRGGAFSAPSVRASE